MPGIAYEKTIVTSYVMPLREDAASPRMLEIITYTPAGEITPRIVMHIDVAGESGELPASQP
jgi:hypothetical protein